MFYYHYSETFNLNIWPVWGRTWYAYKAWVATGTENRTWRRHKQTCGPFRAGNYLWIVSSAGLRYWRFWIPRLCYTEWEYYLCNSGIWHGLEDQRLFYLVSAIFLNSSENCEPGKTFNLRRRNKGMKKLHSVELHYLYSSPNITGEKWGGWEESHLENMWYKRSTYRFLFGKPEGRRQLGRPKSRCEDNIKNLYPE